MCCSNPIKDSYFNELKEFIGNLEIKDGSLITVLHKAQNLFGYLPEEVQRFVAEELDLPLAHVYGVVSFYSYFTTEPKGEYPISVCLGTSCYVRGNKNVLAIVEKALNIRPGEMTPDGKFSLDILRCLGACAVSPVMMVGDKIYQKVTPEKATEILSQYGVVFEDSDAS